MHCVDDVLSDALLHGRVVAGDQVVVDMDSGGEVRGGHWLLGGCIAWWQGWRALGAAGAVLLGPLMPAAAGGLCAAPHASSAAPGPRPRRWWCAALTRRWW